MKMTKKETYKSGPHKGKKKPRKGFKRQANGKLVSTKK